MPTSGATSFTDLSQLVPMTGAVKTITMSVNNTQMSPYGVGLSNTPSVGASFKPILVKDIQHSNGIIQIFGGVLQ
jgi:hypothetical protein